jgi:hypothetical protein
MNSLIKNYWNQYFLFEKIGNKRKDLMYVVNRKNMSIQVGFCF